MDPIFSNRLWRQSAEVNWTEKLSMWAKRIAKQMPASTLCKTHSSPYTTPSWFRHFRMLHTSAFVVPMTTTMKKGKLKGGSKQIKFFMRNSRQNGFDNIKIFLPSETLLKILERCSSCLKYCERSSKTSRFALFSLLETRNNCEIE